MSGCAAAALTTADMRSWLAALAEPFVGDDPDRIEALGLLERVKSACAAQQARIAVNFDASQRSRQVARGVPARHVGRGVAEQVALARRESPSRGSRHLGFAKALLNEMPNTLAALQDGDVSEHTATVVVQETACLAAEDRRQVDAELAGRLSSWGPRRARSATWGIASRIDPSSAVARCRKAVNDRYVSLRPAPDTMTYLSALLPVRDGVAVFAALSSAAAAARTTGDPRGRGQVMADTLVDRLVNGGARGADGGVVHARTTAAPVQAAADVAVEIHLVVSDQTLLRGGDAPALLTSDPAGPNTAADLIPAPAARDLVRHAATVWLRRLYTSPHTGQLVAMESTRRVFDGNLRRMLVLRDQTCRTPWCEAPIRHGDHVRPDAAGGPTSLGNGQGLCERCNHTKSLAGWHADVIGHDTADDTGPPGLHTVRTTTPTGHTYDSTAPPLLPVPGPGAVTDDVSSQAASRADLHGLAS